MTIATYDAPGPLGRLGPMDYEPGVCNIGPAEIARRRRAGHTGFFAALGVFAALVLVDAPDWTRFLVAIPAIGAASGYLQAHLKFCAGFGAAGVFNFGDVGPTSRVEDPEARARDRRRAFEIGLASFTIGLAAGIVAVVIPV
jgi:hypothetical protein